MSHEMGHGFGLRHSRYYPSSSVYNNAWDVMSDTWSGCSSFQHSTYGCMGQGTISYSRDSLGWIAAGAKRTVSDGQSATVNLDWLGKTEAGSYRMIQAPVPGETRFFTVEARGYISSTNDIFAPWDTYDRKFDDYLGKQKQGVIIHEVTPGLSEPAHVVDTDLNGNTTDGGTVFTTGESYAPAGTNIRITVLSSYTGGFVVQVTSGANAPVSAAINGPTLSLTNTLTSFTAAVGPANASLPLNYTWSATGKPDVVHNAVNSLQDSAGFQWSTAGFKTVKVSVSNSLGSVASLDYTVYVVPLGSDMFCAPTWSCLFLPVTRK